MLLWKIFLVPGMIQTCKIVVKIIKLIYLPFSKITIYVCTESFHSWGLTCKNLKFSSHFFIQICVWYPWYNNLKLHHISFYFSFCWIKFVQCQWNKALGEYVTFRSVVPLLSCPCIDHCGLLNLWADFCSQVCLVITAFIKDNGALKWDHFELQLLNQVLTTFPPCMGEAMLRKGLNVRMQWHVECRGSACH